MLEVKFRIVESKGRFFIEFSRDGGPWKPAHKLPAHSYQQAVEVAKKAMGPVKDTKVYYPDEDGNFPVQEFKEGASVPEKQSPIEVLMRLPEHVRDKIRYNYYTCDSKRPVSFETWLQGLSKDTTLYSIIRSAFQWSKTPEGWEFWEKVATGFLPPVDTPRTKNRFIHWYSELPQDIKDKIRRNAENDFLNSALNCNFDAWLSKKRNPVTFKDFIGDAFVWSATPEGQDYWLKIIQQYS